ncbi:MAG: hypothetical protein AB7E26_00680 [Chryseobacterium sp.]
MYIENEINNYFAGMLFDKKFTSDLSEKEQKLLNIYLKGGYGKYKRHITIIDDSNAKSSLNRKISFSK